MALYDRRYDPADAHSHRAMPQAQSLISGIIPIIIAIAVAALVMLAMLYPQPAARLSDTNAGPSVKTVAPQPSPSTSPVVPTPNPTTEPRPTQAPIQ